MTVWEEIRWTSGRLAVREAALLLGEAMGIGTDALWREGERTVSEGAHRSFRRMVHLRQSGVPTAYLRHRAYFWDLELKVGPGVLCPRPETEHLVEEVLRHGGGAGYVVADIGTGSGAVALAIKKERPDWVVIATELTLGAYRVARDNIRSQGLDVRLLRGDLLKPLVRTGVSPDALVMNPPYVAPGEDVAPEVRFEPATAVFGGPDGLGVYRRLADAAASVLRADGQLVVEIGKGQATSVRRIVEARLGPSFVAATEDLSGTLRVLRFRRSPFPRVRPEAAERRPEEGGERVHGRALP